MRGKISCSAQKLSLLEPSMIQSVVDPPAFQLANHYVAENRVRIVEANEVQIASVVIGKSGVYEQTIHLKDGSLGTRCTCPLNEQPFCRHSVAALLEYHRWCQPKESHRSPARTSVEPPPARRPIPTAPASDIKLSEVTAFVEWLQAAVKAMEGGVALPMSPAMQGGEVSAWIGAIQRLEDRRKLSEEKQAALEADLRDRDSQLGCLSRQLHTAVQEAQDARTNVENLQQALAGHSELLVRMVEWAKDLDHVDSQIKSLSSELVHKASQLERMGSSIKEISSAFSALPNPSTPI
jgi:hypothetical protein